MGILRIIRMLGKTWRIPNDARNITTTHLVFANHYDVLGITPRATQTDIKAAYYKLSKIHHPDKSSDEASAKKFRAISEAYEVLGNVRLKKMYDKGLIVGRENTSRMEYEPEPEPTDPTVKFYKSRTNKNIAHTIDGRTPIYNFDAWSKNHYGDLFAKSQYDKVKFKKTLRKRSDAAVANRQEAILYMLFALGGLFIFFVVHGKDDYDRDSIQSRKQQDINENTVKVKQ